jgi:hypothetical protein
MPKHVCIICNKEFNRKSNYDYHIENKKKPCNAIMNSVPPKSSDLEIKTENFPPKTSDFSLNSLNTSDYDDKDDIIDLLFKKPMLNDDNINKNITCLYCEKIFTRPDNLQRHLNGRCKSKLNHDELENLKNKLNSIMLDYYNLEKNYQKLETNYQSLMNNNNKVVINDENEEESNYNSNDTKTINNNINNVNNINNLKNNKINNGVINNVSIVQFGKEDINKLNLLEAMKQYLISTGGNIASNMLKYINLNKKYPENHNICITDISREFVKIHDGEKFVTKKFKNVKNDIMKNVINNTKKIMEIYEKNEKIKKSLNTQSKIKINSVSLKLVDGISAEEIVREEIREKEKTLKYQNKKQIDKENEDEYEDEHKDEYEDEHQDKNEDKNEDEYEEESEEEREFTFEERLRIEHLDKKREGLQIKSFENLKEELYNARNLLCVK